VIELAHRAVRRLRTEQVAARQAAVFCPGTALVAQHRRDHVHRFFGQLAEGGDLAAEDGEQRGALRVQVELVVARDGRGIGGGIFQQRAYA
jgi:hypothetical protein